MSTTAYYPEEGQKDARDATAFDQYGKLISGLNDALDTLENRLTAVLKPEYDTDVVGNEPRAAQSPLREANASFERAIERLRLITNRLEV